MPEEKAPQLLIVDDDKGIRDLLSEFLTQHGFNVHLAYDGIEMQAILDKNTIELIILDVMLPGDDGFALCRKIRSQANIPIIMLTAVESDTDRIVGLELGADDYVTKPFNPRELLARIKAILRRLQEMNQGGFVGKSAEPMRYCFANWTLNKATRRLTSPDNVEVDLSAGEYDLLIAFLDHPQHVLNRDQLLDYAKNRAAVPFDRSIDVQISRLRHKIEKNPKNPELIKTVRGGGYTFTATVQVS